MEILRLGNMDNKCFFNKCVRNLKLQGFMFREGQYSLHLCLQQGCVDNLLAILKQKRGICMTEVISKKMLWR